MSDVPAAVRALFDDSALCLPFLDARRIEAARFAPRYSVKVQVRARVDHERPTLRIRPPRRA